MAAWRSHDREQAASKLDELEELERGVSAKRRELHSKIDAPAAPEQLPELRQGEHEISRVRRGLHLVIAGLRDRLRIHDRR